MVCDEKKNFINGKEKQKIMVLKLCNTLTRKKEVFEPIKEKIVSMYTCGPNKITM